MRQSLQEAIVLTASYYGRTLNEAVLAMYLEDLEDLPLGEVIVAYREWRKNPKNTAFPLPAQIRGMIRPAVDPDSAAREIAARITGAITKFGWCNSQDARAYIGEIGWSIVERQGGWMHICQNHGVTIQPSAFQAQIRDQAAASIKFPSVAMDQVIGVSGREKAGELQSAGEILSLPKPERM